MMVTYMAWCTGEDLGVPRPCSELSHFNLTSNIDGFHEWLLSKDIVYVGGGNTFYMLEIWKKNSLEQVFKKAYEKGLILSGVSAGAVCWWVYVTLCRYLQDGFI